MATYYFAAACQSDDPLSIDGTHYEAQYGFGVDSGNGVAALGSSGAQGRQFEMVRMQAGSGQPNQFVVSLCSDILARIDSTLKVWTPARQYDRIALQEAVFSLSV